jgi:hypothetical protein
MTALLFFAAAMIAKIAPPEVIFGGFPLGVLAGVQRLCAGDRDAKPGWRTGRRGRSRRG